MGLPETATVRAVELEGRSLPVRREAGRVLVGLQPGRQQLTLAWTTDEPLAQQTTFDPVELPVEAANVTSQMQLPESRWILWASGPLRGPAVRFWAVLALAVVLAGGLSRPQLSPLKFHEWVLLLIGLTQISVIPAAAVVGWLYLLAWRGQKDPQSFGWFSFDVLQLFLVVLTIVSLVTLVVVVSRGLLGTPEMFITGNGSVGSQLIWFSPAEGTELGQPGPVDLDLVLPAVDAAVGAVACQCGDPLADGRLAAVHGRSRMAVAKPDRRVACGEPRGSVGILARTTETGQER